MLTKEDILKQINEIGEENLTTNLQRKKLEKRVPLVGPTGLHKWSYVSYFIF